MGSDLEDKNISSNNNLGDKNDISTPPDPKAWRHKNKNKKKRTSRKFKIIIVIAILVLCIGAGIGVYFWQKSKAVTGTASTTNTKNTDTAKDENLAKISDEQKVNIEGAIVFKNYSFLEQYMAGSVQVTGVEPKLSKVDSPAQAVADLKYLDGFTGQWSFDLQEASINSFKQGSYKSHFKSNTVVGKSTDGYHAIFNFDESGKINSILLSTKPDGLTK